MSRIAKVAALTVAAGAAVSGAAGVATANSGAQGAAVGSPGIISGNVIQVPVQVPINLCGNTIDIVGLLNPTFGNTCANIDGHHKHDKHGDYDKHGYGHGGGHDKW
ncbi:chaplin [Streptomyces sp. NPDC046215]|uniref:Chaplin domain-containing protein n=1 Tax=Streptomyces stramineus TaxID=173861 RepID=A0ABP3K735_9ACTN